MLDLSLYGGAVFTLVYGSRDATRDVDALVRPAEAGRRLAHLAAQELDLPDGWLFDDVRAFLAEKEAKRVLMGDEFGPGLRVSVPTAAYLLAMKLRAFRPALPGFPGDEPDIRFLLQKMELRSAEPVEAILERFFPHDPLTPDQREEVRRLLKESGP